MTTVKKLQIWFQKLSEKFNKMSIDAIAKSIGLATFDGLKDPKEFIKSFKLQSMCFKWDESEQCEAIQLLLTDKAENLFDALTDANKKVIKEIFATLTTNCTTSHEVLLDRFFERRPNKNELLSAYALSLDQLLKKAMPGLKANEREMLLRRQLGTYLPEHMRALISFNSQKSWEDVLTSIDKALPHTKALDGYAGSTAGAMSMFNSELGGNIAVKVEPVDINAIEAGRFAGVCNYCKEPGHKIVDCDKARAASRRKESESRHVASSAKTGSSKFDSTKQFSSRDSAYRSNKPRDYSDRYSGNNKQRSSNERRVNTCDLDDEELYESDHHECGGEFR